MKAVEIDVLVQGKDILYKANGGFCKEMSFVFKPKKLTLLLFLFIIIVHHFCHIETHEHLHRNAGRGYISTVLHHSLIGNNWLHVLSILSRTFGTHLSLVWNPSGTTLPSTIHLTVDIINLSSKILHDINRIRLNRRRRGWKKVAHDFIDLVESTLEEPRRWRRRLCLLLWCILLV
jgi:hypothetical protein